MKCMNSLQTGNIDLASTVGGKYLTIIRRRQGDYWCIFTETKSRRIFTIITEPEGNNCLSIISLEKHV